MSIISDTLSRARPRNPDARQLETMFQRLGILWGERGDPLDHALRRRDLEATQTHLGALSKNTQTTSADLALIKAQIAIINTTLSGLTFLGLHDTPGTYSGKAGRILAVNSTETGIDFITAPTGGSGDGLTIIDGNDIEGEGALLIFDLEAT
jgi:hypothetical protein